MNFDFLQPVEALDAWLTRLRGCPAARGAGPSPAPPSGSRRASRPPDHLVGGRGGERVLAEGGATRRWWGPWPRRSMLLIMRSADLLQVIVVPNPLEAGAEKAIREW